MKLPNWLHRKPRILSLDEFFDLPPTDPYLASLEDKKFVWPVPLPESIDDAHTRGYWEGRAAVGQEYTPEYHVEIRRDDGDYAPIDEVLLHDATRCLVHLERLDTDHWWLTLSPTGGWDDEVTFDLFRVKKCIEVTEQ